MNIKKIEFNGHYIWIDEDEAEGWSYNGLCYNDDGTIGKPNNSNNKKIIAASSELKLKGVPTYARYKALEYSKPIMEEVKSDSDYDWSLGAYQGFEEGYKEAEKDLFTEDDVRMALSEAFKANQDGYDITTEEIIEKIKQSKSK